MSSFRLTGLIVLLAAMIGTAHGQTAITQAATGVSDIAATLHGSVTPGSGIYSSYRYCWFEFGTTTDYGSTVLATPYDLVGTGPVAVTANPPGLLPNTTYHFRVRLGPNLGGGGFAGENLTFATGPAQTLPSFQSVNSGLVGDTGANIEVWSANSGGSPATVSVEYGTDTGYGSTMTFPETMPVNTTVPAQQARITGLTALTTYHWRLKLTNAQGNTYSADQTFSTMDTPLPLTGEATGIGFFTATLNGSVDPVQHMLGMSFDYGTSPAYGATVLATPSPVSGSGAALVTASLSGLQPATTYHFRLRAKDFFNGGDEYLGAGQTFSTPSNISALPASAVTDLGATLESRIDTGGSTYLLSFEYGTSPSYGATAYVWIQNDPGNPNLKTVSSALDGLLPGTVYHYRLKAVLYPGGPTFYGSDTTFTTADPASPPTVLSPRAASLCPASATLSATVRSGSSAATVALEYGTDTNYGTQVPIATPVPISSSASVPVPVTGLLPATTYHFRFVAENNEGITLGSDATFTTLPVPEVTTNAASAVGSTWATLHGTYNSLGGSYIASFEYGTSTAYGTTTNPFLTGGGGILIGGGGGILGGGILGGGSSPVESQGVATGLLPATTYHFRLKLTDSSGTTYPGADGSFTTVTPVEAWRQNYFQTPENTGDAADMASPLGDGLPNLLKYALGLDPTVPGTSPPPALVEDGGETRLSLTFTRLIAAGDLSYEVQAADDLAGPWVTIASATGTAPFALNVPGDPGLVTENTPIVLGGFGGYPASTGTVTVRDPVPASQAARRFMRLRVSR